MSQLHGLSHPLTCAEWRTNVRKKKRHIVNCLLLKLKRFHHHKFFLESSEYQTQFTLGLIGNASKGAQAKIKSGQTIVVLPFCYKHIKDTRQTFIDFRRSPYFIHVMYAIHGKWRKATFGIIMVNKSIVDR